MLEIPKTSCFLASQPKCCFFRAGNRNMLARIANREDPDEIGSEEAF